MTISDPTPETTSIMKTLSGSTRIERPERYAPAPSHVHAVDRCERSSAPHIEKNEMHAPTNATNVDVVARYPAPRREMRVPASVIAIAAASGDTRQSQPPKIIRAA